MEEEEDRRHLHSLLVRSTLLLSPAIFLFLRHGGTDAPYGKLSPSSGGGGDCDVDDKLRRRGRRRRGPPRWWHGPPIPPRVAWAALEFPNLPWACWCFVHREPGVMGTNTTVGWNANTILLLMFTGHYVNRAVVYPLRMSSESRPVPLAVAAWGFAYTSINGYIQCRALCSLHPYPPDHHTSPPFILGTVLFLVGAAINVRSDAILRDLRDSGDGGGGYRIPRGGMFEYVSCANYSGEAAEWMGYALAGWPSAAPLSFFAFTCSNLIPRAESQHGWYAENFVDYPRGRRAIVPFVW